MMAIKAMTKEQNFHRSFDDCELVSETSVVDGLHGTLIVRDEDGSELRLTDFSSGVRGYSTTRAQIDAEESMWRVSPLTGEAEGRFRRDARVAVGEPFSMLLFFKEQNRKILVVLGRVSTIAICPRDLD